MKWLMLLIFFGFSNFEEGMSIEVRETVVFCLVPVTPRFKRIAIEVYSEAEVHRLNAVFGAINVPVGSATRDVDTTAFGQVLNEIAVNVRGRHIENGLGSYFLIDNFLKIDGLFENWSRGSIVWPHSNHRKHINEMGRSLACVFDDYSESETCRSFLKTVSKDWFKISGMKLNVSPRLILSYSSCDFNGIIRRFDRSIRSFKSAAQQKNSPDAYDYCYDSEYSHDPLCRRILRSRDHFTPEPIDKRVISSILILLILIGALAYLLMGWLVKFGNRPENDS